jgi:hypothetical protein
MSRTIIQKRHPLLSPQHFPSRNSGIGKTLPAAFLSAIHGIRRLKIAKSRLRCFARYNGKTD